MKKIVLIEDDRDLFSLLKYNLEKEGYAVAGAHTGRGAVDLCLRERPDLIILDIMLPDSDGLEICRRLRTHALFVATPLMFLTARASETDRILGLELGANDYIVKPFFLREVIARVKVQLRSPGDRAKVLSVSGIELDRARCRVFLDGNEVQLTATELRLLDFLMSRAGIVFTRDQLLDAVWGSDRAVTGRTVDVYVLRLRQKLEPDPANPRLIRAVRGFGYSFNDAGVHAEALPRA